MAIASRFDLSAFNSFGVEGHCDEYYAIHDNPYLHHLIELHRSPFILGGGSNILLTRDIDRPVFHIQKKGIEIIERRKRKSIIKVGAGELWHDVVLWAVENNLGGIENLSLIPGTMGAAPIQNIGAYGVELKDVFSGLDAISLESNKLRHFSKKKCAFGYRNSIFKQKAKGKYVITDVYLKLTHTDHALQFSYGAIQDTLSKNKISSPTIHDISNVVIKIRKSKLPDPDVLGNGGSFFKNPIIDEDKLEALKVSYPDIKCYPFKKKNKVPAAWLIEQAGWKGYRKGDAGVSPKHALVLVNYGQATGEEIVSIAHQIIKSVRNKFDIRLEPEVNII